MSTRAQSVTVVFNPVGAEEVTADLREALAGRGMDAAWVETTRDDPGKGQARRAAQNGADLVIACGGDGTVRACAEALAGTGTALAVVPAGTGNLLAHNLGIPTDAARALEIALTGRRRKIDVGYVNGEAFTVMAGAGIDAVIMRDTDRSDKDRLGVLAYMKTALAHLNDRRVPASVRVDGEPAWSGKTATFLAANHGALQAGVTLFPDADSSDGRLDFLAVSARGLRAWLGTAIAVVFGRARAQNFERRQGERATVTFAEPTPYELDGEEREPATELDFTVEQGSLTVCVPEGQS